MDDKIYSRNRIRLPKLQIVTGLNKNENKNARKIFKISIILIIAITFAYFSLKSIEPIMERNCKNMAKSIATKISNNKATEVMTKYEYNDILKITKDEEGNIKMVGTDIFVINKIISDVPVYIQEELEKSENNTFQIPLGSFLGSKIFSGIGPKVTVKMQVAGNLDTDLRSEFTSAGINQTLHRIYLEVKCNVIILTPFETMEEQIVNQVLLAEGVIIGNVPNSYYNLEGLEEKDAMEVID